MIVPPSYLAGFLAAARPPATPPPHRLPPSTTEQRPSNNDAGCPAAPSTFEERVKRHLHPLESYSRLLDCASTNRPPDLEDQFRFRWFGLFYQAPEQDAFILRLRLPGGRLKPFQLAGPAAITQQYASGQILLNAQGGLDIPGVPVTSVVEILHEVAGFGLSARRTGGDCVQAIRGGYHDLFNPRESDAPVYPLICALEQAVGHEPALADLPRPCEIVFTAVDDDRVHQDFLVDTLILQQVVRGNPLAGENADSIKGANFLLRLPGMAETGFLFSFTKVAPGCLALLRSWAAGADRSSREAASLDRFLAGFAGDTLDAQLIGAKRVSLGAGAKFEPFVWDRLLPGVAVPGKRLLSRHLHALERTCREQGAQEIRLARGQIWMVGSNGDSMAAATVLEAALSDGMAG